MAQPRRINLAEASLIEGVQDNKDGSSYVIGLLSLRLPPLPVANRSFVLVKAPVFGPGRISPPGHLPSPRGCV